MKIDVKSIPQYALDSLSRPFLELAREYYKNPENQKRYEDWYFKKYGTYPKNASYMKKQ